MRAVTVSLVWVTGSTIGTQGLIRTGDNLNWKETECITITQWLYYPEICNAILQRAISLNNCGIPVVFL